MDSSFLPIGACLVFFGGRPEYFFAGTPVPPSVQKRSPYSKHQRPNRATRFQFVPMPVDPCSTRDEQKREMMMMRNAAKHTKKRSESNAAEHTKKRSESNAAEHTKEKEASETRRITRRARQRCSSRSTARRHPPLRARAKEASGASGAALSSAPCSAPTFPFSLVACRVKLTVSSSFVSARSPDSRGAAGGAAGDAWVLRQGGEGVDARRAGEKFTGMRQCN